jgi:hypothetical protein
MIKQRSSPRGANEHGRVRAASAGRRRRLPSLWVASLCFSCPAWMHATSLFLSPSPLISLMSSLLSSFPRHLLSPHFPAAAFVSLVVLLPLAHRHHRVHRVRKLLPVHRSVPVLVHLVEHRVQLLSCHERTHVQSMKRRSKLVSSYSPVAVGVNRSKIVGHPINHVPEEMPVPLCSSTQLANQRLVRLPHLTAHALGTCSNTTTSFRLGGEITR